MKNEARSRRKLAQLVKEFEKQKLDWHSIAHLARDLSAAAISESCKASEKRCAGM